MAAARTRPRKAAPAPVRIYESGKLKSWPEGARTSPLWRVAGLHPEELNAGVVYGGLAHAVATGGGVGLDDIGVKVDSGGVSDGGAAARFGLAALLERGQSALDVQAEPALRIERRIRLRDDRAGYARSTDITFLDLVRQGCDAEELMILEKFDPRHMGPILSVFAETSAPRSEEGALRALMDRRAIVDTLRAANFDVDDRRIITVRAVVDAVCIHEMCIDQVLSLHGWSRRESHRRALRDALKLGLKSLSAALNGEGARLSGAARGPVSNFKA